MALHAVGAVLAAGLATVAWARRRKGSGAAALAALCAALALWCAAYAAELAAPTLAGKLGWERAEYLGIATFPTLLFVFAVQLSGRGDWLVGSWPGPLLSLAPLVTAVAVWTNDSHRFFFATSELVEQGGTLLLEQRYGPLFVVHAAYSYALVVFAVALLYLRVRRSAPRERGRARLVLAGGMLPLAGNAVYLAGQWPLSGLDPTPLLLCLSAAACLAGSWRSSFLEVAPLGIRAIVERMSEAMMLFDLYGRLVELNQAAERILGGRREDLLQREWSSLFGDEAPELRALFDERSQPNAGTVVRSGESDWYDVSANHIHDHNGRLTSHLLLWRDATSRIAAERALLEETEITQQLARQQTILFQILREAGSSLELEEVARRAVRTVSSLTPWKNVAVSLAVGDDAFRVLAGNGELHSPSDQLFSGGVTSRALRLGVPQVVADVTADPDYILGGSGSRSEIAVPIARRGTVVGVLSVESDQPAAFSEHDVAMLESIAGAVALGLDNARLHGALAERARELEELGRLREHLMNTLVHDLRNPAFAVVGLAELLESEASGLDADGRGNLRLIRESGERILSLASSILEIARLESRTLKISREPCDLAELAAGVLQRHRLAGARRRVELGLDDSDAPAAYADPRLLERVIENLVANAVKFSPDGGRVVVRLASDPERPAAVRLEVSDQGLGVAPEMRSRLFEKFARGNEPAAGTGLGLAFCKLAVEANGGTIWLADESEQPGATFALRLPVAPA